MKDVIELRSATQEDYGFLYKLHCATMRSHIEATWGWDDTWQQRHFEQYFQPEADRIIVLNGHDVGRVLVDHSENKVHISNIQILPEHQNKGIGSLIILEIIQQAQQRECPVTLQVLKVNPARRLYERLGFMVEGEDDAHFKMRRT